MFAEPYDVLLFCDAYVYVSEPVWFLVGILTWITPVVVTQHFLLPGMYTKGTSRAGQLIGSPF